MNLRYFKSYENFLKKIHCYKAFQYILSIFDLKNLLTDLKLIKHPYYSSDIYKFSTGKHLIKHFDGNMGHQAKKNSGDIGYGFLHYAFIRALKPSRVLCIGSRQGFIPAICALACKDNQKGHVDFVDAGKNQGDKKNWGGIGFWKKNDIREHFNVFGIETYLSLYIMTSKEFSKKYPKRKYEYMFIDGDHSYEGVKIDFETFWSKLATKGIMGFHDINLKGLSNNDEYGVWKLWEELKKKNQFSFIKGDNAVGYLQKNE